MAKWSDLVGTLTGYIRLGLQGVRLKNSSGALVVRNTGDTADAAVTASTVSVSNDSITINSDAANSGADYALTIARPATGMTAGYTLTLPDTGGSPSQVLSRGSSAGTLVWTTLGGTADKISTDTTTIAFGTTSPLALFTLPANAVVQAVRVNIDTAFNGTPSLSIGITGTTSKYLASTQVDLTAAATTVFEVYPGLPAVGTTEALIATYSAGSATAGAARIEVDYVVPS